MLLLYKRCARRRQFRGFSLATSRLLIALLGLSALFSFPLNSIKAENATLPVVGWIEKIKIGDAGILIHAKMDTGADHSSLHAKNIESFERKGKNWIRFEIRNRYGEKQSIEAKAHRMAKIKRIMGKSQERIVVRLGVCVGKRLMEVDVNLVDRSNLSYPMLVGREFLAGNVIVDASKTYTTSPKCNYAIEEE